MAVTIGGDKSFAGHSGQLRTLRIVEADRVEHEFDRTGAAGDRLHMCLDRGMVGGIDHVPLGLAAGRESRGTILDVVARTADVCFMPLSVGGGIRSVEDARRLLLAGADKISIMTAAVADRNVVSACADAFGSQAVVVSVDAKRVGACWEVFTHGGRNPTGLDAVEYAIEVVAKGAGEILLTSMDRDGAKTGYDLELVRAVSSAVARMCRHPTRRNCSAIWIARPRSWAR
eukprot:gene47261-63337_t